MTEVFQNLILILLGMLIVLFTIDPVAMAKKKLSQALTLRLKKS